MRIRLLPAFLTLISCVCGQTNNYPYILKTLAGAFPLGDGGPATSALLYYPTAAVPDSAGNLYILDSFNFLVRKVTTDGKINTFASIDVEGWDMKMGPDGSLYIAASAEVFKISPAGVQTNVAGNGIYGHSGDGGAATAARLGDILAIAFDTAGNLYLADSSSAGSYIREITTDGRITTIAGTSTSGFNGDSQLATSAELNFPAGVAVDHSGNIYVADTGNSRIRKFTVGGSITTIAGNGSYGPPIDGSATSGTLGSPEGMYLDSSGNVYTADADWDVVIKINGFGTLSHIAGDYSGYDSLGDGTATSVSLTGPQNVTGDQNNNLFIVDQGNRVHKLTPAGTMTTVAGRIHFAGDNGPAVSALLNEPEDVALDSQGNVFIADGENYRIRKVNSAGTISTFAGNGVPGYPASGTSAGNVHMPYVYQMATDANGNFYLAAFAEVLKITPGGSVSVVAGTGYYGDTGDGGLATAARFKSVTGIAVDSSGNIYVADSLANRVRVISAGTGIISAFAGTGAVGSSGDGGLATGALLDLYWASSPLAVDQRGNVYIADGGNYKVRMVSSNLLISTLVGNGKLADPNGVAATKAGFSVPISLATDSAGNLYIGSLSVPVTYCLSDGIIRHISGSGTNPPQDGAPALQAAFFSAGLKVDSNGDIYVADSVENTVRKLILNSPTDISITDGNGQTGQTGQPLSTLLKVRINGRAGVGLAGVAVSFAVTSGAATLSAATTQTDNNGDAAVGVTLGAVAGSVVITATASGTGLSPVQFTETAIVSPATCSVPQPVVSLVRSAGDFGGSSTIAPGSWIEIYGSNLSQTARSWAGSDFNGTAAPTSLDGVIVTIDGKKAFPSYISPQQINVQAPDDAASGSVPLIVTTASCSSAAVQVTESPASPGVLAPSSFTANGKQYLVATFPDGVYVGTPNLVSGLSFRPAVPGDVVTVYGIGFGAVTPSAPSGQVVGTVNSLPSLTVTFGNTPAKVQYGGLALGVLGLYQFNLVVPNVPNGDYLITFQLGSVKTSQNVYLTVGQ